MELTDRVSSLAGPVVVEAGCELVEVQFLREGHGWVLRLFIDREEGVTLDHCVQVSREVANLLEIEDVIDRPYHLEVSSPGLDRRLKSLKDFMRFQGRLAKIVTSEPVAKQQAFIGRIASVDKEMITIVMESGTVQIPYSLVSRARLEVEI